MEDLDPNTVCKKPCPLHGFPCPVVGLRPGEMETMRKVFGDHLNRGPHSHLCLFDLTEKVVMDKGRGAHSWHDGDTKEEIASRLQALRSRK